MQLVLSCSLHVLDDGYFLAFVVGIVDRLFAVNRRFTASFLGFRWVFCSNLLITFVLWLAQALGEDHGEIEQK